MTVILSDCCWGVLRVTVGWQSDNTRYTCASGEKALASTIFVVNLCQKGLSWQSYQKSGYPKTLQREMELAKTKFTFRSVCLIWDLQEHKSKRTIKQVKKSLSASIRSLSSKILISLRLKLKLLLKNIVSVFIAFFLPTETNFSSRFSFSFFYLKSFIFLQESSVSILNQLDDFA